jgi:hypothetical protein
LANTVIKGLLEDLEYLKAMVDALQQKVEDQHPSKLLIENVSGYAENILITKKNEQIEVLFENLKC